MREGSKRAARSVGSHVPKGRAVTMSRAALFHQVPCRAPHHHHSSVIRDGHARGQAHLGPRCTRRLGGRTYRASRSGLGIQIRITQSSIVLTIMPGRSGRSATCAGTGAAGCWCWASAQRSCRRLTSQAPNEQGPPGIPGWPSRSLRSLNDGLAGGALQGRRTFGIERAKRIETFASKAVRLTDQAPRLDRGGLP